MGPGKRPASGEAAASSSAKRPRPRGSVALYLPWTDTGRYVDAANAAQEDAARASKTSGEAAVERPQEAQAQALRNDFQKVYEIMAVSQHNLRLACARLR